MFVHSGGVGEIDYLVAIDHFFKAADQRRIQLVSILLLQVDKTLLH
jgi:hypothetical protein